MADTPKTSTELLQQKFFVEKTFVLDDGETEVTARVNEDVIRRIRKYLPVLQELRGVVGLDDIDESHPDVQKKLQARARSNSEFKKLYQRRRSGRTLKGDDLDTYRRYVETAITAVQKANEPDVQLLLFQITAWSVLYDDLFSFDDDKNPVFRLEIEIPDTYWEVGIQIEDTNDPLDDLIGGYTHKVKKLNIDRENPLEWMLALTTTLISDTHNPKFAEDLQEILANTIYYVSLEPQWRTMSVDEVGFHVERLVGDMEEEVQPEDNDDDGGAVKHRARKTRKKAEPGESDGSDEQGCDQ